MQKNTSSIKLENSQIVGPPSPLNIPNDCVPSDEAFEIVAENLINDVVLDFCFQVQRASRVWLFKSEVDENVDNQTEDIFGQVKGKLKSRVDCPHCPNKIEARRFAKHLEKCSSDGPNRQSSRKATKRLNLEIQESDLDDDEDIDSDGDVSYSSSSRKKPKKKTSKVGNRKKATKDPFTLSASSEISKKQLLQMFGSYENVFNQFCGVRSRHTNRLCMNSLKCSTHTEELKKQIRREFMPDYIAETNDPPIDVVHHTDEEPSVVNLSRSISRGSSPEFNNSE